MDASGFAMSKHEGGGLVGHQRVEDRPAGGRAARRSATSLRGADRAGRLVRLAVIVASAAIWAGLMVLIF